MLKIRDGVDLKELEKYGFIYNVYENSIHSYQKHIIWNEEEVYYYYICADKNSSDYREIIIETEMQFSGFDDTLYDLIKADLIEKVDE